MTFWKTVGAVLVAHLIVTFVWLIIYGTLLLAMIPKS